MSSLDLTAEISWLNMEDVGGMFEELLTLLVESTIFSVSEDDEFLVESVAVRLVFGVLVIFAADEELREFLFAVGFGTGGDAGVVDVDGFRSSVRVGGAEVSKAPDTDVGATTTRIESIGGEEGALVFVRTEELFGDNITTTRAFARADVARFVLVDDGTAGMESVDSGITDLLVSIRDVAPIDFGTGTDVTNVIEVVFAFATTARTGHGVGVEALDAAAGTPEHLHAPGDRIAADSGIAEDESSTFFGVEVEMASDEVGVFLEFWNLAEFVVEEDFGGVVGVFGTNSLATELAICDGVGITREDADGLRRVPGGCSDLSGAGPAHTTGGDRKMTEGASDLKFSIGHVVDVEVHPASPDKFNIFIEFLSQLGSDLWMVSADDVVEFCSAAGGENSRGPGARADLHSAKERLVGVGEAFVESFDFESVAEGDGGTEEFDGVSLGDDTSAFAGEDSLLTLGGENFAFFEVHFEVDFFTPFLDESNSFFSSFRVGGHDSGIIHVGEASDTID